MLHWFIELKFMPPCWPLYFYYISWLQTTLKALSGAVSYIDSVHHESLLFAVRFFFRWMCLRLQIYSSMVGDLRIWLILIIFLSRFREWASGIVELILWMHCWNSSYLWYVIILHHPWICNYGANGEFFVKFAANIFFCRLFPMENISIGVWRCLWKILCRLFTS